MNIITCPKGCCLLKQAEYSFSTKPMYSKRRYKAGVFIYDPQSERVLIVQSRGNLWGSPKGTREEGESEIECAIREVKEETGLDISPEQLSRVLKINVDATYFYLEREECEVHVQDHIPGNDANGIGWIRSECVEECARAGLITLNQHFCIIFKRYLETSVSSS